MTATHWIAILAVIIPCVTAFLVGYWHRKQIRQVELFRLNPKVGILPPPSPPVAFFRRNWPLLAGLVMPLSGLLLYLSRDPPVSNLSTILITFNVASMLYTLLVDIHKRLNSALMDAERHFNESIGKLADAVKMLADTSMSQSKALAILSDTALVSTQATALIHQQLTSLSTATERVSKTTP